MLEKEFDIVRAGYNTVLKMIDEANREYYEQVAKEWSDITKQAYENIQNKEEGASK